MKINLKKARLTLLKAIPFTIPLESIKVIVPQLNLPTFLFFIYLLLFLAKPDRRFHSKPVRKQFFLLFMLYGLLLTSSIINFDPRNPGGYSILRQMPVYLLMFYFISNEIIAGNTNTRSFINWFLRGTFLLLAFFLAGINVNIHESGRLSIMSINPNKIAVLLSMSIIMIIDTLKSQRLKPWLRLLFYLSLPLVFYIIIRTGSRGGVIGLMLGVLAYYYFSKSGFVNQLKNITKGLLALVIISFIVLSDAVLYERFFGEENALTDSRLPIWENVIEVVEDDWLIGVGVFRYSLDMETVRGSSISTHNEYLSVLAYSGLFGLIFFLWFLYKIFISAYKKNKLTDNAAFLSLFFIIAFTLFKGGGALLSIYVWLIMGLVFSSGFSENNKQFPIHAK